jgi:hypothetical protein
MQIDLRVNLPEMGKLGITPSSKMVKFLGWQGAVEENVVELFTFLVWFLRIFFGN